MTSFVSIKELISSIDGWLSSTESRFLFEAAKHTKGIIVEIGSWKGKSTVALAAGVGKNGKVFAIDPHEGIIDAKNGKKKPSTYKEFLTNIKRAGMSDAVIPIKETSEDAGKRWKESIGLLFIDGLHDYLHTRQDITLWTPYVSDGGIIAFHDAYGSTHEVFMAVKEFLPTEHIRHVGIVGSILYLEKGMSKHLWGTIYCTLRIACIFFGQYVYHSLWIPQTIRFFITHRVVKFLLLDRIRISMIYP